MCVLRLFLTVGLLAVSSIDLFDWYVVFLIVPAFDCPFSCCSWISRLEKLLGVGMLGIPVVSYVCCWPPLLLCFWGETGLQTALEMDCFLFFCLLFWVCHCSSWGSACLPFSFWLKVCFPCCWSIIWFFEWCCASSFPVSPFCWLFSWIEDYGKASLVVFSCSFDILLFPYSLFFFPLSRSFLFFNSSSPLFIVQSSSMLPWCLHYMK